MAILSDIYAPVCAQGITSDRGPAILDARSRWYLHVIARPKTGITLGQARAALAAAAPGIYAATGFFGDWPCSWP